MRGSVENEETGTKPTGALKKTNKPKNLSLRSEEKEPPSPGGKGKKTPKNFQVLSQMSWDQPTAGQFHNSLRTS